MQPQLAAVPAGSALEQPKAKEEYRPKGPGALGKFSGHVIPVATGVACFLGLWFLASLLSADMPGPLATITKLYAFLKENFWGDLNRVSIPLLLLYSLTRVMVGFIIGAAVAIPLGFLVGTSPFIQRMFNPFIELFRPISPLAWYPVALVMFSAPVMQNSHFKPPTMASIFVIFICSLWPTVLNTAMGVTHTSKDYLNVARMLRMNQWQVFRQIYWPAALPSIVTGLRISLGIAWMVIVAAEMLNGQDGIGFFCWDQYNAGSVDRSILAMFLIGLIGLILNVVMLKFEKMVKY